LKGLAKGLYQPRWLLVRLSLRLPREQIARRVRGEEKRKQTSLATLFAACKGDAITFCGK
jgi:hypothetical protein